MSTYKEYKHVYYDGLVERYINGHE